MQRAAHTCAALCCWRRVRGASFVFVGAHGVRALPVGRSPRDRRQDGVSPYGGGRAALPPKAQPMAEPMDCSRSACKPFRSARPRARTQGGVVAKHSAKRFQRRAGHGRGQGKVCDHHSPFPRARSKGHAAPTASPTMANNHASCKGYDPQTHPPPPRGKTRDNCGRAGSDTHLP